MEDEHPNDHINLTKSEPMLMKVGDKYVIGCVVVEINHMISEFKQYYEVIDSSPPEKDVFKILLEQDVVPAYRDGCLIEYGKNYTNP